MKTLRYTAATFVLVAGCSFSGVTGTSIDTYATASGPVSKPTPSSAWTSITAVGASGKTDTGTLAADGTLRIPGVPIGDYTLDLTRPPAPVPATGALAFSLLLPETARTLDLGTPYTCRPALTAMTQATNITLNAALTIPWQTYTQDAMGNVVQPNSDLLEFFSASADVSGSITASSDSNQSAGPANGATTLSDWTWDAQAYWYGTSTPGGPAHLIDGSQGDSLIILHNVMQQLINVSDPIADDPWQVFFFDSTQEAFTPAAFTMTQGGTTTLSGSFAPVSQQMFTFDYAGTAFNALLADAPATGDAADAPWVYFDLYHEPGAPAPGVGADVTLLELSAYATTTFVDLTCNSVTCDPTMCTSGCNPATTRVLPGDYMHALSYGDPFTTGQELVYVALNFYTDVTSLLSGPSQFEALNGSISIAGKASDLTGMSLQPRISLPRNVKVNGSPAPTGQVTTGVGATPTITFDAPTLGTPSYYSVWVVNMDAVKAADGTVTSSQNIAKVLSSTTNVTVPSGLLQTGHHYYFQVVAALDPDYELAVPNGVTGTNAYATTFTGLVAP